MNAAPRSQRRAGLALSLRSIILLVAVGGIALSGLSVGWVAEKDARTALQRELEGRLLAEGRALARVGSDALLADFPELALVPLITELREQRPELLRAVVTDHQGLIRGSDDPRELGETLNWGSSDEGEGGPSAAVTRSAGSLFVSCPVQSTDGKIIGRVHLSAAPDYVDEILKQSRVRTLGTTFGLVALGVALTFLLISRTLGPLREITRGLASIGRGELRAPIRVQDRTELGLLAETINDMASTLDVAQRELVEKERLRHEMELARELQLSLLSLGETTHGEYRISTSYHPAMEVGGDYCDVFEIDEHHLALVLADVSGKGLGGCLVTAMLSVGLRSLPLAGLSPREGLLELERRLVPSLRPGTFVTIFLGILDLREHRLRFASAAHNPLLALQPNGACRWHYTRGIPLGAVGGGALAATLTDEEIPLEPGAVLVQTTDGISEARSAVDGEQLGFQRLAAIATEGITKGGPGVLELIQRKLGGWRGKGGEIDDETLLVIERVRAADTPASPDREDSLRSLYRLMSDRDHLQLRAQLEDLARLPSWLATCRDLRGLEPQHMTLLRHGLYEACANVMEHCYELDPTRRLDLWRLPAARGDKPGDPASVLRRVQGGYFMIRDDGRSFDAEAWRPTDFEDPATRLRGRGIGLDVIHASMQAVTYLPDTPVGNVTLLRYDPSKHTNEETSHGEELRDPLPR